MRRIALLALIIGFFAPILASAPAHAQATRTWVSGVGDDANPCSRTAPCKTFAGAISKTAAAGEINCLDPGGFGAVTITKSITLNCSATLGSVLVAGTNGINISAATTDKVVLRGIQIQGVNSGLVGVKILSASAVSIEDCVITQFTQQGINDARASSGSELYVRNTIVSHNTGNAISLVATAANKAFIENSSLINNAASGIGVVTLNNAMITRTNVSGNGGIGIATDAGSVVNVDSSTIAGNGTGVSAGGTVRLSNSDVTLNTTGFGGSVISYGNNRMLGNTSFGTAVTAAGGAVSNLGEQ
jgi:hypothetical protein